MYIQIFIIYFVNYVSYACITRKTQWINYGADPRTSKEKKEKCKQKDRLLRQEMNAGRIKIVR